MKIRIIVHVASICLLLCIYEEESNHEQLHQTLQSILEVLHQLCVCLDLHLGAIDPP